jgi:colicin import membrane protein
MGKSSLIKSTTKKKPAKAIKTTHPKSDVKPKKKVVKAKEPAKKKPAVKAKTTTTVIKKAAPKATTQAPVKQPSKARIDEKPLPKKETPYSDTPASTDHMPPPDTKPANPAEKMLYYGVAVFVLLVLMVVIASWMNTRHYYVKPSEGAVDIRQGKFAPKGTKHLITFPGLQLAEPIKDTYTAKEVFPIIYQYYLDKADMLLDGPGMPDFDNIKEYLNKSLAYATTRVMKTVIKNRLDAINLMVLLYKADVAAGKNSLEGLKTARDYLKEALGYQMDELESARIKQKVEAVGKKMEDLKAAAAKTTEGEDNKEQRQ